MLPDSGKVDCERLLDNIATHIARVCEVALVPFLELKKGSQRGFAVLLLWRRRVGSHSDGHMTYDHHWFSLHRPRMNCRRCAIRSGGVNHSDHYCLYDDVVSLGRKEARCVIHSGGVKRKGKAKQAAAAAGDAARRECGTM